MAQLYLNYKLKSVAHLPWRQMTYKFLNTIVDDLGCAAVINFETLDDRCLVIHGPAGIGLQFSNAPPIKHPCSAMVMRLPGGEWLVCV